MNGHIFYIFPILVLFVSVYSIRGLHGGPSLHSSGIKSSQRSSAHPRESEISDGYDFEDDPAGSILFRLPRSTKDDDEEEEYLDEKEAAAALRTPRATTEAPKTAPGAKPVAISSDIDLPPGYNIYEIPKHPDKAAIPVHLHIEVVKILDFDELNEMLKLDLEFKVMWTDYKILFHHNVTTINLTSTIEEPIINFLSPERVKEYRRTLNNPYLLEKVWKPNLFIENLLSVRQPVVMARPLTIKYIPRVGWFEYITRITVKLNCEMNFRYYPADTQTCEFIIRGFSYNKNLLNLNWFQNGVFLEETEISSFDTKIDSAWRFEWAKRNDPDEVFRVVAFKFAARRKLSYHLIQTYLASTFYIIITCLCFLLPARMVEARIGISMTTLLTLTAMFASVRESTPITSYTKAIDIWMVGCIFFVFLTLAQFTFTIWLKNAKEEAAEKEEARLKELELRRLQVNQRFEIEEPSENGAANPGKSTNGVPDKRMSLASSVLASRTRIEKYERWATMIDAYSFAIFLAIFTVYTVLYWSWLMTSSDYFSWKVNSTLNNVDNDD